MLLMQMWMHCRWQLAKDSVISATAMHREADTVADSDVRGKDRCDLLLLQGTSECDDSQWWMNGKSIYLCVSSGLGNCNSGMCCSLKGSQRQSIP